MNYRYVFIITAFLMDIISVAFGFFYSTVWREHCSVSQSPVPVSAQEVVWVFSVSGPRRDREMREGWAAADTGVSVLLAAGEAFWTCCWCSGSLWGASVPWAAEACCLVALYLFLLQDGDLLVVHAVFDLEAFMLFFIFNSLTRTFQCKSVPHSCLCSKGCVGVWCFRTQ